ncbi:NAD(P)-dependent dehydrogenase, short-chain alcohol dehydrogenase family [Lentibacillus halodurans]|uniref:NAD(P)-dependent dehydrogenase, short-chain alcohol dehydrogenase family n=1 Tax=Lentibacillus halodurans TaxID=237679 RepID=A0A1I0W7N1_9BACI|nr:glucose 1-dehydrogenase [Lentibacillus halodurans]SFA84591.1 NAD(P)-dependent dehydrogenase, short-chain alcohol dehydrogenase family [Lentibacillus halodurans]
MNDMFNLQGKLAVVMGGTSTLGSTMALGLAQSGADIVLTGRNEEKASFILEEIRQNGVSANFIKTDVRDNDSIKNAADVIDKEFGGWDILINSAGVNSSTPFFDIDKDEWDSIMDVNLKSVMFTCQEFARKNKVRERGGSVINISSVSSIKPLTKVVTYSASKAGINSITEFMAQELASDNIRVNAIIPGFFPAEQNRKILTEDRVKAIMDHTPMKRFGSPEELQGAVIWLASEKAAGFVTGSMVTVDGGFGATKI